MECFTFVISCESSAVRGVRCKAVQEEYWLKLWGGTSLEGVPSSSVAAI